MHVNLEDARQELPPVPEILAADECNTGYENCSPPLGDLDEPTSVGQVASKTYPHKGKGTRYPILTTAPSTLRSSSAWLSGMVADWWKIAHRRSVIGMVQGGGLTNSDWR
jgi:hypothetical protein